MDVQPLIEILEEQIKVYRHLLDVVRKEKDILIAANLDDLTENNRAKEAMLIKIRALETDRIRLAKEVHTALGMSGDEPRLLDMAVRLNETHGEKLRSLHSVLDLLLRRVQDYNRQNETLVQSALNTITGAMNVIKGALEDKPTYQKKGEVSGAPSAGKLVSREV